MFYLEACLCAAGLLRPYWSDNNTITGTAVVSAVLPSLESASLLDLPCFRHVSSRHLLCW